jgi:group I intron endonuclease
MKRYGSIYLITNKHTGRQYVGQTTRSISERFADHLVEKRNRHVSNSIRKYGKDSFVVEEVFVSFDKEGLNNAEIYFVEKYNTLYPNGYNHRAGGNQNGVCSDELKKKISLAKTGKPNLKRRGEFRSETQRMQISRSLGGQNIIAIHLATGEIKVYKTAHSTKEDGHNPSNVVQICKKSSYRTVSKGWTFVYESEYANQSGSSRGNTFEHAQRLGLEPAQAE